MSDGISQKSKLWNLKEKLQFSGWLQYIPPVILATIFLLFAVLTLVVNLMFVTYTFAAIGGLLLLITQFDLLTVKYNFKPSERLPEARNNMDVFELMMIRRSCRSFQNRKLETSHLTELLDYTNRINAPGNKMIGKNDIRFEYINAQLTVWPVVGAQEFLVAIVPKKYCRQSVIDVGRYLQKVVLHATKMGLATCWIGPGADQSSVVSHLGDRFNQEEDHIICVCAIGYKSWFKPLLLRMIGKIQHKRLPLSSLFFADLALKKPLDVKTDTFNKFQRCYEVCQWAPSAFNGQSTRCVGSSLSVAGKNPSRSFQFDFYATTKSRYYAPVALGIWCANWEIGSEALGIKGHFKILPEVGKVFLEDNNNTESATYDVSWISEE